MPIIPSINDVKRSRRLEEDNTRIPKSLRTIIQGASIQAPLPSVLSWVQIGQLIDNGFICDIDASGNRIVIGSLQLGGSSTQVYDWDGTNWVQLGNTITGTYTLFGSDYNVGAGGAISGDGTWLAIRSVYTNDPGDAASVVLMFNWDGINWVLKSVLEGTGGSFDNFGYTITFNSLDGLNGPLSNRRGWVAIPITTVKYMVIN